MEKESDYIKKQFAPYEIAFLLKELGFNEGCLGMYYTDNTFYLKDIEYLESQEKCNYIFRNCILAPLWQQVIVFLKTKGVFVTELWDGWEYGSDCNDFDYVKTREEAVLKAIELCNIQKKNQSTN